MPTLHSPTHRFPLALLAACALLAVPHPARAQAPGDPIDIVAFGGPNLVIVAPSQPGQSCTLKNAVRSLGGTTLFGATSPGGQILGQVQEVAQPPRGDDHWCPGFAVNGPPPGTYWVAMVYGLVTSIDVPLSAWKPVVVPAGCTGVPNPPVLLHGQPTINGSHVSVAFGGAGGCPIDHIEMAIGTTPGGSQLGTRVLTGILAAASVPTGEYYMRAYAVNRAGRSNPSMEAPVRVPGPCASGATPAAPLNPSVTVNGHTVTIAWGVIPSSAPVTFYQLRLINPANGGVLHNILLPTGLSFTASGVPSGQYQVRVVSGNACGIREPQTPDLIFTVP